MSAISTDQFNSTLCADIHACVLLVSMVKLAVTVWAVSSRGITDGPNVAVPRLSVHYVQRGVN